MKGPSATHLRVLPKEPGSVVLGEPLPPKPVVGDQIGEVEGARESSVQSQYLGFDVRLGVCMRGLGR